MLASILSFFAGHGDHEIDHDHEIGDHEIDHDHEIGDHETEHDHGNGDQETAGKLAGKFSLTVISLAVSIYGWAGLGITSILKAFILPAQFIPGVENVTAMIAASSGIGAVPFGILAWYAGAKFYTFLKGQESRPVSGLIHAIGYDGVIETASLSPSSTSQVSIALPGGHIVKGFAKLAKGINRTIPEGARVRVVEVTGNTAIVEPEDSPQLPKG